MYQIFISMASNKKQSLNKNMQGHLKRDSTAGQFSKMLLKIGDGNYPESEGKITLPPELVLYCS